MLHLVFAFLAFSDELTDALTNMSKDSCTTQSLEQCGRDICKNHKAAPSTDQLLELTLTNYSLPSSVNEYTITAQLQSQGEVVLKNQKKVLDFLNEPRPSSLKPGQNRNLVFISSSLERFINLDVLEYVNGKIVFHPEKLDERSHIKNYKSQSVIRDLTNIFALPEFHDYFLAYYLPSSETINNMAKQRGITPVAIRLEMLNETKQDADLADLDEIVERYYFDRLIKAVAPAQFDLYDLHAVKEALKEDPWVKYFQSSIQYLTPATFATSCLEEMKKHLATSPSQKSITEFQTQIDSVLSSLRSNVIARFSSHSQKALNEKIKNIRYQYPPTHDEFLKKAQKLQRVKENEFDEEDIVSEILASNGSPSLFSEPCGALSFEYVSDASLPSSFATSEVHIGKYSLMAPEAGKGILAHEMGHLLTAAFLSDEISQESKQSWINMRSCLKNLHETPPDQIPYKTLATQSYANIPVSLYLEEDWADLVEGMATGGNSVCSFAGGDMTGLTNLNPIDPHSSPLFRAIHLELITKGQLPESCPNLPQIKNCFAQQK